MKKDELQIDEIPQVEPSIAEDEAPLTDEQKLLREKEERRIRSAKMRKKFLPILAIILTVMIVIPTVLTLILQGLQKDDTSGGVQDVIYPDYYFHKPYDGNILEYDAYLSLNRNVEFYDNIMGYGMMELITENSGDRRLKFIHQFLMTVINGDAEHYNTLFNENYYQNNAPQADFEQQMLYAMKVYFYSSEELGNGEHLYTYALDYKIRKNNGTYRRDILSDEIRTQFIVLHTYSDGSILIENLVLKKYATK